MIDDYSLTSQSVTADNATPNNTNFALASEVVGGERDIEVTNTAGLGQITVLVDPIPGTLSIGSLGNGEGTALLQYDGTDGTIALDATGLSSVSLTGDPTGTTPDPAAGLIVLTRSDAAGETLTVTVHTDAANSSDTTIAVPLNLGSTVETFVPFSAFSIVSGTGADFTDVGAIEASVTLAHHADGKVEIGVIGLINSKARKEWRLNEPVAVAASRIARSSACAVGSLVSSRSLCRLATTSPSITTSAPTGTSPCAVAALASVIARAISSASSREVVAGFSLTPRL